MLVIVLLSKFTKGAYIAIIAMAVIFAMMKMIRRHYEAVARETALVEGEDRTLPQPGTGRGVGQQAAQTNAAGARFRQGRPAQHLEALTVSVDPEETERLVKVWEEADTGVPLKVIRLAVPRGDQSDHRLRREPAREKARVMW